MTKRLNIDIIAKDKSRQALNQVQGNLQKTRNSVLNLKNALIGLGVGTVIKGFVDTGKEIESLQVRFKFLFGSVEEGKIAFDNLAKFAGRVPFSLEEISRASGNLAVVADDANDLNRILEITGNVAAVTGLDFETTSSQIQRAFSGGIGAADLFRERGVRALLGFQAGAKVTAEETIARFEELFSGDGQFANATKDLANTLEGTLSMIGDKYFNFQKQVSSAFFDELKGEFKSLDDFFAKNEQQIEDLARDLGTILANSITVFSGAVRIASQNSALLFDVLKLLIGLKIISFTLNAAKGFTLLATAITSAAFASNVLNSSLLLIPKRFAKVLGVINLMAQENQSLRGDVFDLVDQLKELSSSILTISSDMNLQMNETKNLGGETLRLTEIIKKSQEEIENSTGKTNETLTKQIDILSELSKRHGVEAQLSLKALRQKEEADKSYYEELKRRQQTDKQVSIRTAREKIELEKQAQSQIVDAVGDGLSKVAGLNKDAFRAYQAFQIGMATLNTFRAVSNALATYPFPLNVGVAAAETARGLATVAQIRATPAPRISGGRVNEGMPYMVGEGGKPELFVPQQSGTIVPNNQLTSPNINITINANDTEGFDELLVKRRSVIVNVINDALNSQGKEALV